MQTIREALTMTPDQREAFERDDRRRMREHDRLLVRSAGADKRISAAEAKRARRRERNKAEHA